MSKELYIAIDTETGGLDYSINPLLQVGAYVALLDKDTMEASFIAQGEWNVKPSQYSGKEFDPKALAVNGLNLEILGATGHTLDDIGEAIVNLVSSAKDATKPDKTYILGQNLKFDFRFMQAYLPPKTMSYLERFLQKELMDKSEDYHLVTPEEPGVTRSTSLGAMATELQIVNERAHTSLSDAKTTFEILVELDRRLVALRKK